MKALSDKMIFFLLDLAKSRSYFPGQPTWQALVSRGLVHRGNGYEMLLTDAGRKLAAELARKGKT